MKYTVVGDVKQPKGNRGADAGVDCFVPNDWNDGKTFKLYLGEQVNIPTQIKVRVPSSSYMLRMDQKSGVAIKKGIVMGATVIDFSYTGIPHMNLFKVVKGSEDKQDENGWYTEINPGDKIAQAVLIRVSDEPWEEISNEEYDALGITERGDRGFGNGTGQN